METERRAGAVSESVIAPLAKAVSVYLLRLTRGLSKHYDYPL